MEDIKQKVSKLVEQYRATFPEEYSSFLDGQKIKIEGQATKWAEAKGTDFLERLLTEIPETLFAMIQTRLIDEDYAWFNSLEGQTWFAKAFPEFRRTEKV